MEELTIKHGPFIVFRRVLGGIILFCGILWLVMHIGSLRIFDWIYFITFLISGGSLITKGFGSEKSFILAGEGFIKIKWMNRFRPLIIQDIENEKITLTRFYFLIDRKDNKSAKFSIDFLEKNQKKEVYDFLIEYAKKRNLELVRNF